MELDRVRSEQIVNHLKSCFSQQELNKLGRKSRFIQRSSSRLDGQKFLLMNVFNSNSGEQRSLNDSCDWLEEHFAISMSKQSLDERYNTHAVCFMKSCFIQVLNKMNKDAVSKLPDLAFSCIQLTDSTSFKIPENLSTHYKGYKGNAGKAVIKLHLNYDLQTGCIADIYIGDGCMHDNAYNFGAEEKIKENGLYLRDLGYYSFAYFKEIEAAKAYYLSRAKTNATFYTKTVTGKYEKIALVDYLPKKGENKELEQVYLGSYKEKLAVRLVVEAVPEEVAQKRLAALKVYESKHKDKTVSVQRKSMCYFNVFITNIPASKLAANKIRAVYSLRWQVELMFKIWKSHYCMDKFHKMNIFRFESYLYARLIAVLIDNSIQNIVQEVFMGDLGLELSPIKASKHIKKTL